MFAADQPALCYMHLAIQAGKRVPEDLKVITYDGMDVSRLCYPEVTAICQNVKFLAESCARTVLDLIDGKYPFRKVLIRFDENSMVHKINGVLKMEEIIREK